ncbi:pyridoxamine 5'-phosphate oxidase family protein [Methyloceanibacter sp.]|uniref:pyridoxamine 5'-phosphate oxidase family protein n=1 Tax=Methyloceanibacter sp. TaxID=1965321 RepID=UPI002D024A05|nr:pyridoxamine 5'-phosphate oxidase family protein [Methyloceanibacter sp.]HML91847.1 pyridoxamine 5'-phosphate oxidase family protein [Methyloceanibacter sp.]
MPSWMNIAFTPSVKDVQARRGSREAYARKEATGTARTLIDDALAGFVAGTRSFYLATASRVGQPYVQHRGGPPGVLRVLDESTLAFADFSGNRQYITAGNLAENPLAMIFIMDYGTKHRVKLWGTAEVVENDRALIERLMPDLYDARAEAAIVFHLASWDTNCPQHIPQMIFAEEAAAFGKRIAVLEAENARLRGELEKIPHATGETQ